MPAESAVEPYVDYAAIERQARAARSAWVGGMLRAFFQALMRKIGGAQPAEVEMATAKDIAELERRIRDDERMQPLYH